MTGAVAVLGVGPGSGPAHVLAEGLAARGITAAVLTDRLVDDARFDGPVILAPTQDAAGVTAAVTAAVDQVGPVHALVDVSAPALPGARAITELDDAAWARSVEEPLRRALHVLQAAHAHLAPNGGCIVIVVPTASLSGAAGAVSWMTVCEGYRSLAKAAARAWGSRGVTVNCVAVPAALLWEEGGWIDRPGLAPAALDPADLFSDVAGCVAAMVGEGFRSVTGTTVAVDGGVWMTP